MKKNILWRLSRIALSIITIDMREKSRQSVRYTVFSHIYEHYENSLFSFVAPFFAAAFFQPGDNARMGVFYAMATSFAMRPIGAIIFSWIGDKQGRRKALMYSISLCVFPAILIAVLPPYEVIGGWASAGLILVRVLQGISVGGGFYATLTLISETDQASKRNLLLGVSLAFGFVGAILGTFSSKFFMNPTFPAYAWRIPFIIGAIYGIVLFYFKQSVKESHLWEKAEHSHEPVPFFEAVRCHPKNIIAVFLFGMAILSPFYVVSSWLPGKITDVFQHHASDILLVTSTLMAVCGVGIVLCAWLSTWIKPKLMLSIGCLGLLGCFFVLFNALSSLDYSMILTAQYLVTITTAILSAPAFLMIQKLFPVRYKFSGFAVPFAVGQAVFLGPTPILCERIVAETGTIASGSYVLLIALIFIATATYLAKPQKDILS